MTTESDSALTGAAFELVNAGYTLMPDPEEKHDEEAIGSDSGSLREAAAQRSGPLGDPIIKQYVDQEGNPLAPNQAVTLERAARDYVNLTAAERLADEKTTSKELAAHVDALRAEALAGDPDAAELYGFEPLEEAANMAETDKAKFQKTKAEPSDLVDESAPAELDPELEKVLQHPQVR